MTEFNATDPQRMRALAHPTRLALVDHLRRVDEATATECAEAIGESVASCSFHLHTLAKYGFAELAPQRGREKPWRWPAGAEFNFQPADDVPGSRSAAVVLAEMVVLREVERLRAYLAGAEDESHEWISATAVTSTEFWATAEELTEVSKAVVTLVERMIGDRHDPEKRPEGARRARLFGAIYPEAGS